MDIPFLKLMSDAYVSDSSNNLNINEVSDYLLKSFNAFKNTYPDTAKKLYKHSRSFQQDLIYSFLDTKYDQVNEEYIDEGLIDSIRKKFFPPKEIVLNPEQTFMLAVVSKNYNNCNRMCTANTSIVLADTQIADLLYINPRSDPTHRTSVAEIIQRHPEINIAGMSKCLRFCYLDYMTSIYAEGILSYETCVRKLSGNDITISSYADMLKAYPIDGMCNEVYLTLSDLYKEIDKMLDYIYLNDSMRKKKWIDVIALKLSNYRSGKTYRIDFSKIDDEFEYPTDNVRIVAR
jgi:hypothetical protein